MNFVIALVAAAFAAAPATTGPATEIFAANARWTEAVAREDMATVEALVSPNFRLTGGDAKKVVKRAAWLATLKKLEIANYKTEITDLEVHGNTAIATISGSWDVSMGGSKRNDKFHLIDVWIRDGGRWRVIRRHIAGK